MTFKQMKVLTFIVLWISVLSYVQAFMQIKDSTIVQSVQCDASSMSVKITSAPSSSVYWWTNTWEKLKDCEAANCSFTLSNMTNVVTIYAAGRVRPGRCGHHKKHCKCNEVGYMYHVEQNFRLQTPSGRKDFVAYCQYSFALSPPSPNPNNAFYVAAKDHYNHTLNVPGGDDPQTGVPVGDVLTLAIRPNDSATQDIIPYGCYWTKYPKQPDSTNPSIYMGDQGCPYKPLGPHAITYQASAFKGSDMAYIVCEMAFCLYFNADACGSKCTNRTDPPNLVRSWQVLYEVKVLVDVSTTKVTTTPSMTTTTAAIASTTTAETAATTTAATAATTTAATETSTITAASAASTTTAATVATTSAATAATSTAATEATTTAATATTATAATEATTTAAASTSASTALPSSTTTRPSGVCNGKGTCQCDAGYRGPDCSQELNWCQEKIIEVDGHPVVMSVCGDRGTCVSTPSGARCVCHSGFTGQYCDQLVPDELWLSKRCLAYNNSYNLPSQYSPDDQVGCGDKQECVPDDLQCLLTSCKNPIGWCLPNERAANYSIPDADFAYRYIELEEEINNSSNSCSGHGQCVCDAGYTGQECESELNWCEQPLHGFNESASIRNVCGQNGTCVSQPSGAFCICEPGFTGEFCHGVIDTEIYIAHRCYLYAPPSPVTTPQPIPIGCETPGESCVPDNFQCFLKQCKNPIGWCLFVDEDYRLRFRMLAAQDITD